MKKRVIVGMSGGVDSSLTAYILKEMGYDVVGLFMRNWQDDDGCTAASDFQDVALVSAQIGIPYYSVNFTKEYYDQVFARTLIDFKAGRTPNPDILCNSEIKFKVFFEKALALEADYVATGHYCRVLKREGRAALGRGVDEDKDQSYFLYAVKSEVLERVLFPLGEMTKREVRERAKALNLVTAEKKNSTGICFVGKRDFPEFLSRYLPKREGDICTLDGDVVGKHEGVFYYTIGQRHGLHIGGKGPAWFVVDKEIETNRLIVVQGEDHPALWKESLLAKEAQWVRGEPLFPLTATAKIRYRAKDYPCVVEKRGEELYVKFDRPLKAITPGQSVVFYQGEECLGGAIIEKAM